MKSNKMKQFITVMSISLVSVLAGCSPEAEKTNVEQRGELNLAYVNWSSEVASTHVVEAVLEQKLGYSVNLYSTTVEAMWQDVATGKADAIVAAWLPSTHGNYYDAVKDKVEDLGPNLEGTQIGLAVPDFSSKRQTADTGTRNESFVKLDSIDQLKGKSTEFGGSIIGIDPEAGIMLRTREAIKAYGLNGYELIEGSESSMVNQLSRAIQLKKPIVITGWTPLWINARWKLKYLKDPKNIYGGKEAIHTIVRQGLKKDHPQAYAFLDRFNWSPEQMQKVMVWNQNQGTLPAESALRFIESEKELVSSWLP